MSQKLRRVVVTGLGMVTSLGTTVKQSWVALLNGQSGIIDVKSVQAIADNKMIPNCYMGLVHPSFDRNKWKVPFTTNSANSYVLCAADEALRDAAWIPEDESGQLRTGVNIGVMSSNVTKMTDIIADAERKGFENINRLTMLHVLANMPTANITIKYKFKGPSMTASTACSTGASAVGDAYRMIQLGEADVMVAGSTEESLNPTCIHSAIKMQAMSTKKYDRPEFSSRPFDKSRSGFILGEGAGVLVLEELSHALQRKAKIYAEIKGYGCTSDGFHLTRPMPDGNGGLRSMLRALEQANLRPEDIDHINCHATSTPAGDECEVKAIFDLLQGKEELIKKVSISANKSALGHCFGAAGSIESIFSILSLKDGVAPAILNLDDPIPAPGLSYVIKQARNQEIRNVIKNAFGFGGVNVSLIFSRFSVD